ncbi:MAG TPA: alanine racemase [Bacillota bacterium]|nr:alanine racemase [Bacillota bacterium]
MNKKERIQTPALLLNIGQMNKNITDIIKFAKQHHINYRPHIKTHKCIEIAKRQIQAGAIGITVATVGEAERMVHGGIDNILIAFPVSAEEKLQRILQLMNRAKIIVAVDSMEQATLLNRFFKNHQQTVNVWIKVNAGLNRCGVEPNNEVVQLAKHITKLDALLLDGIFTHAGHAYTATSNKMLEQIAREEADAVLTSAKRCEQVDIKITHKSIGATPTFKHAGKVTGITEIRPGNAVFYDMVQVSLNVANLEQCALSVVATVASVKNNRAIIDAGSKTLALDKGAHGNESISGHGYIVEYPQLVIERLSEEHGVITGLGVESLQINERLTIIPNHACTVANLFDYYTVVQDGTIVDKWPVDARGQLS